MLKNFFKYSAEKIRGAPYAEKKRAKNSKSIISNTHMIEPLDGKNRSDCLEVNLRA